MESKTNNHTMKPEQVAALVENAERATAKNLGASAADIWGRFVDYVNACKASNPPTVPTYTGFSHALGFASERGYRYLAEKGGDYPAVMKKIDESIIEGVAQRMMNGKANQVGCIFWLKNKAGFRDRQPDEVAAEADDWIAKLQSFAVATGKLDARNDEDVAAQPLANETDLLRFELPDAISDADGADKAANG